MTSIILISKNNFNKLKQNFIKYKAESSLISVLLGVFLCTYKHDAQIIFKGIRRYIMKDV